MVINKDFFFFFSPLSRCQSLCQTPGHHLMVRLLILPPSLCCAVSSSWSLSVSSVVSVHLGHVPPLL